MTEPEWAMATILFSVVRGFTSFAERSTAREAVSFLNAFFAAAVPAVTAHGGWAHKLLGDGLLAVFTAPTHADDAVAAGEAMLAAAPCDIGIGINSGLVLVGEIGGGDLLEHGVVGDPVNVAARVQDATRSLGEPLLVTEATRVLMEGGELEERGTLELKGRTRPVTLFGRPARTPSPGCSSGPLRAAPACGGAAPAPRSPPRPPPPRRCRSTPRSTSRPATLCSRTSSPPPAPSSWAASTWPLPRSRSSAPLASRSSCRWSARASSSAP